MRENLWTLEQDLRLIDLCQRTDRSSAKMARIISIEFGRVISRSAVRGRARRLGLDLPVEPDKAPEPAPAYQPHLAGPTAVEYALPRFTTRMKIIEDEGGPGILLLNRASTECANPVEGEGMRLRVCGAPIVDQDKSYCADCYRRLYRRVALRDPFQLTAGCH